jgi:DNA-directed RNA polymerase sigma subunit (sigma70/sigma32)
VIIRHYGLDGGTPQTLYEISRHLQPHAKSHRRAKAYKYERKAIARLQAHLGSTYQGQRGQGSLPTSRGNSG